MISVNVLKMLPKNTQFEVSFNILKALVFATQKTRSLQAEQMPSSDDYDNVMDERLALESICKKINLIVLDKGWDIPKEDYNIIDKAEIVLKEMSTLLDFKKKTSEMTDLEKVEAIAEKNAVNTFNSALNDLV